jgi:hypothetical protein
LNALCRAVVSAITAAIAQIKAALCIPVPHFGINFNLGTAGGARCNGISLLGPGAGINRPLTPSIWSIWGLSAPVPYIATTP